MTTNGEAIEVELLGIRVFIGTVEKGKGRVREVMLNPKQARKLIGYIKHNIHGGHLLLSKDAVEIEQAPSPVPQPPEEERRIITP